MNEKDREPIFTIALMAALADGTASPEEKRRVQSLGSTLGAADLLRLTHDHTYVQSLVDSGQISAEEAQHHPRRSLLTRAMDGRNPAQPDLSVREVRVGDRFLLCSDGLSGVVSDETIADAGEPLMIRWFNRSYLDLPVWRPRPGGR